FPGPEAGRHAADPGNPGRRPRPEQPAVQSRRRRVQEIHARRRRGRQPQHGRRVMITQGTDPDAEAPARRPPRRADQRRRLAVALIVLAILAGAAAVVDRTHPYGISFAHPLGVRHHAKSAGAGNGAAAATATIARRSLAARTSLNGTLGYAGDYTIAAQGHGTLTWLPAAGQVIRQGEVLYRADGQPVVLLYGSTPAYRTLAEGAQASDVTGADVAQLNRDLVALGYASRDDLDPSSDEFS